MLHKRTVRHAVRKASPQQRLQSKHEEPTPIEGVEDLDHVGVMDAAECKRFPLHSFSSRCMPEQRCMHNFDGNVALVALVEGQEHIGHATTAERFLQDIAFAELLARADRGRLGPRCRVRGAYEPSSARAAERGMGWVLAPALRTADCYAVAESASPRSVRRGALWSDRHADCTATVATTGGGRDNSSTAGTGLHVRGWLLVTSRAQRGAGKGHHPPP